MKSASSRIVKISMKNAADSQIKCFICDAPTDAELLFAGRSRQRGVCRGDAYTGERSALHHVLGFEQEVRKVI
ncbi:hypothetical protein QO004_001498 [Rhizobium mesoamericanum]|nr:hypothetical protein [Rhizobium mesoamericanum]